MALVGPRENRNRQAWLILIPLFLVIVLWQWPIILFRIRASIAGYTGLVLTSVAMGWTIVWLLGPWLGRGSRPASFIGAWGVMLAVGAWRYFGDYGLDLDSLAGDIRSDEFVLLVAYVGVTLSLLLAMKISRLCCRKRYRPGPLMAWLYLWMVVACAVWLSLFLVFVLVAIKPGPLLSNLVSVAITAGFFGTMLYLVNLPFMILALKSPFYRERFQSTFGLEEPTGEAPFGTPTPIVATTQP